MSLDGTFTRDALAAGAEDQSASASASSFSSSAAAHSSTHASSRSEQSRPFLSSFEQQQQQQQPQCGQPFPSLVENPETMVLGDDGAGWGRMRSGTAGGVHADADADADACGEGDGDGDGNFAFQSTGTSVSFPSESEDEVGDEVGIDIDVDIEGGEEDFEEGDSNAAASDDDDEEEEEEDGEGHGRGNNADGNGHIGLHQPFFRSTGWLPGPNAFAPPFYNRPPTPLPPSPSLTSLLRPSFSATTSRPTTPDTSENETTNDTEAAVAKSARNATTVPRASPKVPTYEYYGFVLYLASSCAFLMYLLWSYLPSPFLHQLGIHYYPNRWWSLAIPAYLVMTIVYIYVALAAYNTGYLTLPMNSIENLVDEAANIAVIDSKGRRRPGGSAKMNPDAATALTMGGSGGGGASAWQRKRLDWREVWNEGTDAVMDIPIGGVCEVLYGCEDDSSNSMTTTTTTSHDDAAPAAAAAGEGQQFDYQMHQYHPHHQQHQQYSAYPRTGSPFLWNGYTS
ncbi:hypothetical protein VTO42DRAFT_6374 [Malbranchea cinnamomea]